MIEDRVKLLWISVLCYCSALAKLWNQKKISSVSILLSGTCIPTVWRSFITYTKDFFLCCMLLLFCSECCILALFCLESFTETATPNLPIQFQLCRFPWVVSVTIHDNNSSNLIWKSVLMPEKWQVYSRTNTTNCVGEVLVLLGIILLCLDRTSPPPWNLRSNITTIIIIIKKN